MITTKKKLLINLLIKPMISKVYNSSVEHHISMKSVLGYIVDFFVIYVCICLLEPFGLIFIEKTQKTECYSFCRKMSEKCKISSFF